MAQQEVKFNGITTIPSDYQSKDGDLERSVNLINEGGQMKSVIVPSAILTLLDEQRLLCIHRNTGYYHYIVCDDTSIYYIKQTDETKAIVKIADIENIKSVKVVGNTLVILAEMVYYALYTGESYTYLGNKPPFLVINFGLNGEIVTSDENYYVYSGSKTNSYFGDTEQLSTSFDFTTEGKDDDGMETLFTNNVHALVNKFIADESTEKNKFIMPFFIRYAYKLYDGTLFMHSVPVFMTPLSDTAPIAFISKEEADDTAGDKYTQTIYSKASALACDIDYTIGGLVKNDIVVSLDELNKWSDIIKSVDIYISAPIYIYDQNESVKGWKTYKYDRSKLLNYSVSKLTNWNTLTGYTDDKYVYKERSFFELFSKGNKEFDDITYRLNPEYLGVRTPVLIWDLPRKTDDEIAAEIRETSLFYKAASINLEDIVIGGERKNLEIDDNLLKSIKAREVMNDDYISHNPLSANSAFVYNSRINLANITMRIAGGTPIASQFNYESDQSVTDIYTYLKKDNKEIVVHAAQGHLGSMPKYVYFPDADAYKIVIKQGTKKMEFVLTPHPLLNGASYFEGFRDREMINNGEAIEYETYPKVSYPNKLFTSSVNNPFDYPSSGVNTVGTGEITTVSSSTKALSQGQFGQFPLYVFSSDGVWAMEVSSTGGYSTKQPATRDVLISEKSLTQVDGSVFFATKQGIMVLEGSNSFCITDIIGERPLGATMKNIDQFYSALNITDYNFEPVLFKEYVKGCMMAYDYPNKRIVLFNPGYEYSYIYSTDYKNWGMLSSKYIDVCNDYPTALVVSENNIVYDIAEDNTDIPRETGMFITRSIKFEAPDILKTINSLKLRGIFDRGDVAVALYGSMDNKTFHVISSSIDHEINGISGSPFKFFKLVVYTNLQLDESLYGASFLIDRKRTNKLR